MSKQNILTIRKETQLITIDILDNNTDLKVIDDEGDSLLHAAFKNFVCSKIRGISVIETLLDRGLDINVKNREGRTILHLAIERRYKNLIDLCIRRNIDLSATDPDGNTYGHFVIEEECRKCHSCNKQKDENESSSFVDWLVSKGIDFFYKRNVQNYSPLYLANELNLQHILLTLLKRIEDLPTAENNQTPLLFAFFNSKCLSNFKYKTLTPIDAACYGYRYVHNIVKIILEKNKSISNTDLCKALYSAIEIRKSFIEIDLILEHITSVEQENFDDESLLQFFTSICRKWAQYWKIEDCMKIVRKLVRKGANINELDVDGETISLKWFFQNPNLEMLRLLKDCGTDFNVRTNDGQSFLHIISRQGVEDKTMIEFILSKTSCDPNTIDNNGDTPLHIAMVSRKYITVMDLIKYGARLDIRDRRGRSPLHLAVDGPMMVQRLIKNGADVNARDNEGKTPLHYVTHEVVVGTLTEAGAFVDDPDNQGRTPLFYAVYQKSLKLIVELLKRGADMRDSIVYQNELDYFRHFNPNTRIASQYMVEHLVKLSAAGLLKKTFHTDKKHEEHLKSFYEKCQKEVELLKKFFVEDSTSLYRFLYKNRNRRCAYADDKELKKLVEDAVIEQKFPNYFVLIMGCQYDATIRKPLLEKAICVLKKIVNFNFPELCIDEILLYLSNADLSRLVQVDENL